MKTITIDGIEYQLTPVPTKAPKLVQWEPKRANIDREYICLDNHGNQFPAQELSHYLDEKRSLYGNYFYTEAEAQEAAKQVRHLLRLRAYVREFAPDYKPDWNNPNQRKWFVIFDGGANKWSYSCNQFMSNVTTVYMPECAAKELAHKLNNGEVVL